MKESDTSFGGARKEVQGSAKCKSQFLSSEKNAQEENMHRNSPVCRRQSKQCEEGWDGGRRQEALLRPCGSHQRGLHFPENKGRAMQSRGIASTSATEEQGGGTVLWPHTPPKLGES